MGIDWYDKDRQCKVGVSRYVKDDTCKVRDLSDIDGYDEGWYLDDDDEANYISQSFNMEQHNSDIDILGDDANLDDYAF